MRDSMRSTGHTLSRCMHTATVVCRLRRRRTPLQMCSLLFGEGLIRYPEGDEALPWLYGVARNTLSNRSRSSRRRDRLVAKLASRHEATANGPETQIVRNEEHEELIRALSELSEKDQEILRLVEWDGVSRDQVADMFFVSRAAIDKRISWAYKKMAHTLGVPQPDVLTTPVTVEEGGEA